MTSDFELENLPEVWLCSALFIAQNVRCLGSICPLDCKWKWKRQKNKHIRHIYNYQNIIHIHTWSYMSIHRYRQIGTVTAFLDLWKSSSWDLPATKHLRTASTLMLGVVCGIKIFAWRSEKALKGVKTWSPRHLILRCRPLAPGRFKDLTWSNSFTDLGLLASWHCFEIRPSPESHRDVQSSCGEGHALRVVPSGAGANAHGLRKDKPHDIERSYWPYIWDIWYIWPKHAKIALAKAVELC